jgi:hypothetical protein
MIELQQRKKDDIMSDATTTPNHTDRPPAGDEAAKPIAPLWIFKVINPSMKGLLQSPLHRLLSDMLCC